MYKKRGKFILDILLAVTAIVLFTPIYLLIALLIKLDSKGPVLFKQKRIGRHKLVFSIYKFRTMRIDTPKDTPTHLLTHPDQHITKMGKLLRKTSLDELPQLLNVLKGEMSLVGPRPALWNQEDLIAEREYYHVHSVLPGVTGWAQLNGRDELPISVKAKLDGEYIDRMSFLFDMICLIKTVSYVLKRNGYLEGAVLPVEEEIVPTSKRLP